MPPSPDGAEVVSEILKASLPRPDIESAEREDRNKYAVRFAEHMAKRLADDLRSNFKGIDATGQKAAGSLRGRKQLDVNFSTPSHGLELGISLKSVHLRDRKSGRYTHNMKRNEEELRIEASGYHKRQPYAFMVGVLFLPFDSCDDARGKNPSSFGSWVRHLRPFCGRSGPADDPDKFEKIYIGLYEPDGSNLRFFDVESDPPRSGRPPQDSELIRSDRRPRRSLTYIEFLDAIYHQYLRRNSADFRWAEGEEAPLDLDERMDGQGDESDPS